jgi:hypothetical protein
MVKDRPVHKVPLFTVIVGVTFTVTLLTAVLVATQPWALVPVTLYEVFTNGDTIAEPLEYVYVLAPPGTMVNELPVQMLPLFTVMVGETLTVMVLVAVDTQPKLAPVTT